MNKKKKKTASFNSKKNHLLHEEKRGAKLRKKGEGKNDVFYGGGG